MHLSVTLVVGVCAVFLLAHPSAFAWREMELIAIENLNASGTMIYDLRVVRLNREQFGVSGTVAMGDYQRLQCTAKLYHSSSADGRYKLLPFRLPKRPCCEHLITFYGKYVMRDLANCSDLPQVETPNQEMCDMFDNRTFTIRKYVFNPIGKIPKIIPLGNYKIDVMGLDGETVVCGSRTYSRFT